VGADSFGVCLSVGRADAATGPSTPASLLLQKKADTTTPTIQAAVAEVLLCYVSNVVLSKMERFTQYKPK
jgi:hypothetical protein